MKSVIFILIFIAGLILAIRCRRAYIERKLLDMCIMRAHLNKLSKRYVDAVRNQASTATLLQYLQELQEATDIYNKHFSKYDGYYDIRRYME